MKIILLGGVFLTIYLFSAIQTFACSCAPEIVRIVNGKRVTRSTEEKIREEFKGSFSVFSGKVVNIRTKYMANKRLVTFEVDKYWKNKKRKRITVSTGLDGSDCGFPFEAGKKYLVYAFDKDMWVSECSRTNLFSEDSEDVKVLDLLQKDSAK